MSVPPVPARPKLPDSPRKSSESRPPFPATEAVAVVNSGAGVTRLPRSSRKRRRRILIAALVVGAAAAGAAALLLPGRALRPARTDLVTHAVRLKPLQLTIVERGTLESADNRDIVCRVKAGSKGSTVATTIKWVIDDGSHVRQGDVLVELDDSGLQEQLKTEKITLDGARASAIQAEENYKIVKSQNESDIQSAKITIDLARLDLEKYLDGEYPQTRKDILGRMKMAESDKDMQQDRAAWAARMVRKGYLTASQAEAETSRLQSNDIALKKVQEELRVLDDYTRKRTETDLRSKLEEARRALERVEKQALAKEVQADTDRQSKESIYEQELARYQEIEDEIRKCVITAPQDGMVVYSIPDQARFGGGSQQSIIAQGEPVREGQKLMRIPDLRRMLVNTKVHEALVSRVRGEQTTPTGFGDSLRAAILTAPDGWSRLVADHAWGELRDRFRDREQRVTYRGQPASVRVDAFPDRLLSGHVKSVATVSAQQDWLAADVKVYQTMVAIDEPLDGLKPGMSAEVTVVVDTEQMPVLTIPLQAIIGSAEMGRHRRCFVVGPAGRPEERDIVLGLSNEKVAEVKSGLAEGEQVVLNPRVLLGDRVAPAEQERPPMPKSPAAFTPDKVPAGALDRNRQPAASPPGK